MTLDEKENIDNILTFVLIRKLVTPIIKHPAYMLGLVNAAGKVIKNPVTPKERMALTTLDKIIFKLKRLLGGKLLNLNNFLYLTTMNNDMYDKLVVRGNVSRRAEIQRIIQDVNKTIG